MLSDVDENGWESGGHTHGWCDIAAKRWLHWGPSHVRHVSWTIDLLSQRSKMLPCYAILYYISEM